MEKREALKEAQYLGEICRIVYNEHYLPSCKSKPIRETGFLLSKEFIDVVKNIPKDTISKIKARAKLQKY